MISYMQVTRVEIRVILCVCVEGGGGRGFSCGSQDLEVDMVNG